MATTLDDILNDAEEVMGLLPDGKSRSVLFDLAKLTEECGEVAECFTKPSKTNKDLGDELADMLLVIGFIAKKQGVFLDKAYVEKKNSRIQRVLNRYHAGHYPTK